MTVWGAYVGPSTYQRMRIGYDASQSPAAVTSATVSVDISVPLSFMTYDWDVLDTSNDLDVSGDWTVASASVVIDNGSGGALPGGTAKVIYTLTKTVTLTYGATQTEAFTASLAGINAIGTGYTAVVSGSVTVPARPYALPTAPDGVTVTRNSDTSHTVAWTRHATTAGPYTSQLVQRSTDGGAYATVATVSGTATSYTDTTTAADHSYDYRVVATNSTGSTPSAPAATVYTTPKAPGTPSATKSGSNIVLAFTNTARHDAGIKVYRSDNGGAFNLVATVATADLVAYTDVAPNPAQTHAYKVATYVGSLVSALSAASPTVQLLAAPAQPTNLGPGGVHDATEALDLTWQHNPMDTTAQTKHEVQYRVQGAGSWTSMGQVSSPTQGVTVDPVADWGATNGQVFEWQVRTWGDYATASPWSATSTVSFSARPTATLSSPLDAGTLATSSLTVAWAYYDAEATAQSAWQVELYDDASALVESRAGAGTATTQPLTQVFDDGSTWTVRVRVQDSDGMWSTWDQATFTVSYALPPTPVIDTITWDPDAATVTLEITTPDPSGAEVATDHVDVWRAIDDGPFELIATGVPPSTAVTDYSPTVAGTNTYRLDAVSALPSTATSSTSDLVTPQPGDHASVWISGGPGFSQTVRATMFEISRQGGRDERVLRRYAGRPKPVAHDGEGTDRTLTLAVDMILGDADDGRTSPPEEWFALADLASPHLWRDPTGRRMVVALGQVAEHTDRSGIVVGLSLPVTEVGDA